MRPSSAGLHADRARFNVTDELNLLRQRLRKDRELNESAQAEMISAMQEAMEQARMRLTEERNAARRQSAFLRRCRVEADAARSAFEADVKRRQAFFDSSEAHKQRRDAEKARAAEETSRRSFEYGEQHFGGTRTWGAYRGAHASVVLLISTATQEQDYAQFETEFAAFEEASTDDEPIYGLHNVPWPPASCPVSGVRRSDALDVRKQRLKNALLRWHPDKFVASHAAKILEADRQAVFEAATAIFRRVQAERAAAENDLSHVASHMGGGGGASSSGYGSAASGEAAAAAAGMAAGQAAAARGTHAASAAAAGADKFYPREASSSSSGGSPASKASGPPRSPASGPRGPAWARAARSSTSVARPAPRPTATRANEPIRRPSKRFQEATDAAANVAQHGPRSSKYLYESRYS